MWKTLQSHVVFDHVGFFNKKKHFFIKTSPIASVCFNETFSQFLSFRSKIPSRRSFVSVWVDAQMSSSSFKLQNRRPHEAVCPWTHLGHLEAAGYTHMDTCTTSLSCSLTHTTHNHGLLLVCACLLSKKSTCVRRKWNSFLLSFLNTCRFCVPKALGCLPEYFIKLKEDPEGQEHVSRFIVVRTRLKTDHRLLQSSNCEIVWLSWGTAVVFPDVFAALWVVNKKKMSNQFC